MDRPYESPTDRKDLTDTYDALDDLACFLEVLDPEDDGYGGRRHAAWNAALSDAMSIVRRNA